MPVRRVATGQPKRRRSISIPNRPFLRIDSFFCSGALEKGRVPAFKTDPSGLGSSAQRRRKHQRHITLLRPSRFSLQSFMDVTVTGAPGTTVTGPMTDNGDGSYTVPVDWNAASDNGPGIVIGQPGRPPVVVHDPKVGLKDR